MVSGVVTRLSNSRWKKRVGSRLQVLHSYPGLNPLPCLWHHQFHHILASSYQILPLISTLMDHPSHHTLNPSAPAQTFQRPTLHHLCHPSCCYPLWSSLNKCHLFLPTYPLHPKNKLSALHFQPWPRFHAVMFGSSGSATTHQKRTLFSTTIQTIQHGL